MQSLDILKDRLTSTIQRKFILRYGNILDLLKFPIQVEVIIALAQFYDPPLTCFTFQDFQLAPTLEEFGKLLDPPRKKNGPYQGIGQFVKPEDLAMTLNIPIDDLLLHEKENRESPGLKIIYLEIVAQGFTNTEKGESFGDALTLLIFGLIIFQNMDNFIDYTAISVFWVVKNQGMDPAPAHLIDVYYTMYTRHHKNIGLLRYCIPLLYSWLASHLYEDIYMIKSMKSHEWSQKLVSLTKNSILWYSKKVDVKEIINSCESFPISMALEDALNIIMR